MEGIVDINQQCNTSINLCLPASLEVVLWSNEMYAVLMGRSVASHVRSQRGGSCAQDTDASLYQLVKSLFGIVWFVYLNLIQLSKGRKRHRFARAASCGREHAMFMSRDESVWEVVEKHTNR